MSKDKRSSYEKINYSLRPAKNIERKMMSEVLGRLSVLDNIKNYRYVGLGSAYFADFNIFHKNFGINDLISVEHDEENRKRFDFNNPFSCVKIEYDETNVILPKLNWDQKKTILWLDYDDPLCSPMFKDIDTFFARAKAGSLFLISINAEYDRIPDAIKEKQDGTKITPKEYRIQQLSERVSLERVPLGAREKNLGASEYSSVIYEILNREIIGLISNRNAGRRTDDKIYYKQLFNLLYKDGALMLTVGGIIYDEAQKEKIAEMAFENLEFIKDASESFTIKVPNLTYREINALNNLLPNRVDLSTGDINTQGLENFSIPALNKNDIIDYSNIYRYFPTFAESNL